MDSIEEGDSVAPNAFESAISRTAKRTVDLALAVTVGVLLLPMLVVIAALIKCVSRGPIFYGQVRRGQNGQPFRMWKFRTMVENAERRLDEYLTDNPELLQEWATEFKLKDDPRVIPWVGHVLRMSSIDELPQLWNVLSGEMSLVGPRPLPQYHSDQFEDEFRRVRETMPPGITGQWQVCSRHDGAPEMFRKWDTYYVRNWSIWLDLQILSRTPWVLLIGNRGRVTPATDAEVRPRYHGQS
jgi:lipopolysaccharide/colanic/teichoic acid biosynthesis glycosyltransferase